MKKVVWAALLIVGCKTVVTTTTEVVPSRYALLEFTRLVPRDSAVAYATRALAGEQIKVQAVSAAEGVVKGGPVKFDAHEKQPALDALITISTAATGPETRVRILASSPVAVSVPGGIDQRLVELAQRIERRIDGMIGH